MNEITFFITFIALLMVAFGMPLIYNECNNFKKNKLYKKNAEKQHLMFNQLKKGDYVWRINYGQLSHYMVKRVSYNFYTNGKLYEISIILDDGHTIKLYPEDAKTFKYRNYYSLYSEAKVTHGLMLAKKEKELQKITKVSSDELKKEVNEAIDRIEALKKELTT